MFNWQEAPFFRLLFPFILGILACLYLDADLPGINYLLFFLLAFLAFTLIKKTSFRQQAINGFFIQLFFITLGYQITFLNNDWHQKNHFRQYLEDKNVCIGTVVRPPGNKKRSIPIHLEVQKIQTNTKEFKNCSGKIILWCRNDSINRNIRYGDVLVFNAALDLIKPVRNPEAFDYKRYLRYKNIDYQGFLKSEAWQRLDTCQANPLLHWAYNARANLIAVLERELGSENEFAIAAALILGYKDELSEDLKNAYSNTGAMHVLAVSGLHVGLIWGILAFFLQRIRWRHPIWIWIKTGLTISGLWIFALLTGASPSVLRAATMFSFLLLGMALNRSTNIYNTLAASAFCLLSFDPYLIMAVGFQLSYLAVIGIVYFYKKIYGYWYIENPVGDYIWRLTVVAIAAQLSTFPLTMYYFHQFPIYFLLSGLIVVPFAFLILGTGLSLFFVDKIIPVLNTLFAKILFGTIWLMNALIFLIEQLPGNFLNDIWISTETFLLLYLVVISCVFAINTKRFKFLMAGTFCLLLMLTLTAFKTIEKHHQKLIVFYQLSGKTYIEFIDGQEGTAFGDLDIKDNLLKSARHNFHLKHDIKEVERIPFGDTDLTRSNWQQSGNFIQFFDLKIAFIDQLPETFTGERIKLDYILFRNRSKESLERVAQFFDVEKIIFDGALGERRRLELKQACDRRNILYHDVTSSGALVHAIKIR